MNDQCRWIRLFQMDKSLLNKKHFGDEQQILATAKQGERLWKEL